MLDILVMQVEIALALAFFSGAAAFGIGRDNRHRCHARPGIDSNRAGTARDGAWTDRDRAGTRRDREGIATDIAGITRAEKSKG